MEKKHIAIFASGAGSNADKIMEHFSAHHEIRVRLVVCNRANAGVLNVAEKHKVESILIERERFFHGDAYMQKLKEHGINWIILAGFLWKIPAKLIDEYRDRIINIHPALLPKYGGKGMYGNHVHQAVLDAGEQKSGITIHFVDEHYDHGDVIFQEECEIEANDTPESLARKVHKLEHEYYPRVIQKVIEDNA